MHCDEPFMTAIVKRELHQLLSQLKKKSLSFFYSDLKQQKQEEKENSDTKATISQLLVILILTNYR